MQETLQEANHAALEHLQEHAGFTRTGYHGRKVDGVEPGRWERAGLVVTTWLQGTNRDSEPHDHSHNVVARMVRTESDGVWRAYDTMALRAQIGAMDAIVDTLAQSALAREYGVGWVARADGKGHEIEGIAQETLDKFSTRAHTVTQAHLRLARQWAQRHGREPNAREMLFLGDVANLVSRQGKDDGLPPEPTETPGEVRDPIAVLADCMDRDDAELSASQYRDRAWPTPTTWAFCTRGGPTWQAKPAGPAATSSSTMPYPPDTAKTKPQCGRRWDARAERLGEHAVQTTPAWAVQALGPIPDDPVERLDWQQRASKIATYRELYGIEDEHEVIGQEPTGNAPEMRGHHSPYTASASAGQHPEICSSSPGVPASSRSALVALQKLDGKAAEQPHRR